MSRHHSRDSRDYSGRSRDRDSGRDRDQRRDYSRGSSSDRTPDINSIFKGQVTTVKEFGAFIKIPGCYKNGLVHRSQMSKSSVEDPSDVVQTGDSVWCKVISINDEGKIGLSMKVVSQGSGQDLDPNGVEISQDERKRQSHTPYKESKITLEAVFNTTCKKCGGTGHLAQECFGGKTYDMVPEDDDTVELPHGQQSDEKPSKKDDEGKNKAKKHDKKHKRSHSKKKRKRSSSSSSSEDYSKKRKPKEKRK